MVSPERRSGRVKGRNPLSAQGAKSLVGRCTAFVLLPRRRNCGVVGKSFEYSIVGKMLQWVDNLDYQCIVISYP